ncbi:MAG TPA: hypothetical protein VEZ90_10790 [Blastocatellia bacterium]|nr:hypothetical protein [Blastocatellia bacterium]
MATSKMEAMLDAVPMYEVGINSQETPAMSCPGGNYQCMGMALANAIPTSVHDEKLIDATSKINHILRETAEHRKDKDLMLINVGGQVLLAWGGKKMPEGFKVITDINEIRRVLGVKPAGDMDEHHRPSDGSEHKPR